MNLNIFNVDLEIQAYVVRFNFNLQLHSNWYFNKHMKFNAAIVFIF